MDFHGDSRDRFRGCRFRGGLHGWSFRGGSGGSAFNVTRAGVHADGLMKDEEIYTIFDTKKILNKPATVQISKTSGLAGVAYWINQTYGLEDGEKLDKKSPLVIAMKEWVDQQYEDGRQTVMTERELKEKIRQLAPDFAERG